MKKVIFTALVAIVAVGGAFAGKQTPAKKQLENVYTYYLEGACDIPYNCSPEFEGPICSDIFSGSIVYDEQGCTIGHEVETVLGKLPQ